MTSPRSFPLHLLTVATLVLTASAVMAGSLVSLDFDATSPAIDAKREPVGTVDTFQGTPSQALVGADGRATTGRLPVKNSETDLARLTLNFDLNVGELLPVRVTVTSFDATGKPTGSRVGTVIPPVADSYYRFGLDLDRTNPLDGTFDPLAPFVEFTFAFDGETADAPALHIDNVQYSAPSFFVSTQGSDSADGRTPETAFATLQHAADTARAGDVVLVMDGTYEGTGKPDISDVPAETVNSPLWRPWWVEKTGGSVTISEKGTPAGWIVFRAHPGSKPVVLNRTGWHGVRFGQTAAYIEVRGLTIQGDRPNLDLAEATADAARSEENGRLYHGAARYNANGILADGRPGKTADTRPHHLRIIDNVLFDHSGAGVTLIGIEHVTIEGNLSHDNCHFMRYGSSGLSTLLTWDWDATPGHKIFFVRNTCHGNRTDVPCSIIEHDEQGNPLPRRLTDRFSDGNGIIIDVNRNNAKSNHVDYPPYAARTLVQNNLVFNNGGSGIHTVSSDHVDIVNNTAYLNSASPHLVSSQIYTYSSDDVRIANNILVAPVANVDAGEKPEPVNVLSGKNGVVTFTHNLFFGGNLAPKLGEGDRVADPDFVNASRDAAVADFRLQPDSPAREAGVRGDLPVPIDNRAGELRPTERAPDLGAY